MVSIRIEKNSKDAQKLGMRKYEVVVRQGKQGSRVFENHGANNMAAAKRIQSSLRKQYRRK